MFDKIAIMDNKILISRYIVKWKEENLSGEVVERSIDLDNASKLTDYLTEKQIEYQITNIDVPQEIEQYDNMEWFGSLDDAIKMVNGDHSFRIAELKALLNKYDKKVIQHERCHRMGINCKHDIAELDRQAEEWVAEINRLEDEMNDV